MVKTIKRYFDKSKLLDLHHKTRLSHPNDETRTHEHDQFIKTVIDFVNRHGHERFSEIKTFSGHPLKEDIIQRYSFYTNSYLIELIKKDIILPLDTFNIDRFSDSVYDGVKSTHRIMLSQAVFSSSESGLDGWDISKKELDKLISSKEEPYSLLPYKRLDGVEFLSQALNHDINTTFSNTDVNSHRATQTITTSEIRLYDLKENVFLSTSISMAHFPILSPHYLKSCANVGIICGDDVKEVFEPFLNTLKKIEEGRDKYEKYDNSSQPTQLYHMIRLLEEVLSPDFLINMDRNRLQQMVGSKEQDEMKPRKKVL